METFKLVRSHSLYLGEGRGGERKGNMHVCMRRKRKRGADLEGKIDGLIKMYLGREVCTEVHIPNSHTN